MNPPRSTASAPSGTDRAAAVRAAMRRCVATSGFHGTSMAQVAKEAGVATGTAYVHYASKDDVLLAAYAELKTELGEAAAAAADPAAPAAVRFRQFWFGILAWLRADPDRARFMQQVEASPLAVAAHTHAIAQTDDKLLMLSLAPDLLERYRPLPVLVLFDLAVGPIVRVVANDWDLDHTQAELLCDACWQAITGEASAPTDRPSTPNR